MNTNIEKVWRILGHDFAHPYKWARAVNHSEGQGEAIASIACDERSCRTTMGSIREKITHFSDQQYTLSYDIIEGLPPFIEQGSNTWSLKKLSENKTELHIQMKMKLRSWAIIMNPVSKIFFKKMATQLVEDFAYYVDNGKPHPEKIKVQSKHQAKDKGLSRFYFVAFIVGTLTPLYFIVQFVLEAGGVKLYEFINQLFANNAASTFSSDLLICSFIFWVFMANDKKGKKLPNILYFILLNLTIGLSSSLPLYLYFRARRTKLN